MQRHVHVVHFLPQKLWACRTRFPAVKRSKTAAGRHTTHAFVTKHPDIPRVQSSRNNPPTRLSLTHQLNPLRLSLPTPSQHLAPKYPAKPLKPHSIMTWLYCFTAFPIKIRYFIYPASRGIGLIRLDYLTSLQPIPSSITRYHSEATSWPRAAHIT